VDQGDLDAGSVLNVASATGRSRRRRDHRHRHRRGLRTQSPAITLVKTASPATYFAVGATIDYSYLVTNEGNVRLAGPVSVIDDKATVSCPDVDTVGNGDTWFDVGSRSPAPRPPRSPRPTSMRAP